MKNEVNPKIAITVASIVVVLTIGGIFLGRHITGGDESGGTAESVRETQTPTVEPTQEVKMELVPDGIVGIEETPKPTEAPAATPAPMPANNSTNGAGVPAPTPAPTPAGNQTPATGSNGGGSVPAAPVSTPAPTPAGGSTNSSGQVYVPGFGWVTPSGEPNVGETVGGDGDINKQVGTMG